MASSLLGKNWTEWPAFHPRRPEAARLAIRKDMAGNVVTNVADPNNETFSPTEWDVFQEGAKEEISRLAVSGSSLGSGRLEITKTTYRDGTYRIYPAFIPNNLTDKELSIGKIYTARGDDWPFKDGAAAIQALRDEFQVALKIDQKKGVNDEEAN